MMLSTTRRIVVVQLSLVCAIAVTGCQSDSPEKDSGISRAETVAVVAETLFASEEAFRNALQDKDPLGMIDAALTRDDILISAMYSDPDREIIAETTDRMIDRALRFAEGDELILAEARQRLDGRKPRQHSDKRSGGLLQLGNMSRPEAYVTKLTISALSAFAMQMQTRKDVGVIVYVEHPEFLPIVLTVADSDGASLCEQRNPRGYLLCRWQSKEDAEVTVTVNNSGSQPADVLLIRNQ